MRVRAKVVRQGMQMKGVEMRGVLEDGEEEQEEQVVVDGEGQGKRQFGPQASLGTGLRGKGMIVCPHFRVWVGIRGLVQWDGDGDGEFWEDGG